MKDEGGRMKPGDQNFAPGKADSTPARAFRFILHPSAFILAFGEVA